MTRTTDPRRRQACRALGAAGALGMAALLGPALAPGTARAAAIDLRAGGVAIVLRHAITEPGVGDPPGYRLDDCRSQRNLSDEGRAQARRLGARVAALGLQPTEVRSSRWCRCLDTARLGFGRVEPWPALDSFFDQRERADAQTAELRRALAALPPGTVAVWVTHMVNIAALAGESVAMGAGLVLRAQRQPDGTLQLQRLAGLAA